MNPASFCGVGNWSHPPHSGGYTKGEPCPIHPSTHTTTINFTRRERSIIWNAMNSRAIIILSLWKGRSHQHLFAPLGESPHRPILWRKRLLPDLASYSGRISQWEEWSDRRLTSLEAGISRFLDPSSILSNSPLLTTPQRLETLSHSLCVPLRWVLS